jgi:hypothetical protein
VDCEFPVAEESSRESGPRFLIPPPSFSEVLDAGVDKVFPTGGQGDLFARMHRLVSPQTIGTAVDLLTEKLYVQR